MTNATKSTVIRLVVVFGLLGLGLAAMFSDMIDFEETIEARLSAPAKILSPNKKARNGKF